MKNVNQLRLDPTRTTTLRRALMADMSRRFRALRAAITQLVVVEDAFGLAADARSATGGGGLAAVLAQNAATTHDVAPGMVQNTRWRFATSEEKVGAYQTWLKERVDAGILEVSPGNVATPWLEPYVGSAYKKGVVRAWTDTHAARIAAEGAKDFGFMEGGKEQFLRSSFATPTAQGKIKQLTTRAFTGLKGVTAQMDAEMTRILGDGLTAGKSPAALARELAKSVEGLEAKRALAIARTEIVHAHNEGQLDSFEAMNLDDVGVMAEWSTAHDNLVCPQCQPMEGVVFTIKEARGLLPRHPNCRCAWIPAGIGEEGTDTAKTTHAGEGQDLEEPGTVATGKTTGQVWAADEVASRVRQSIKAEFPKLPTKDARAKTRWVGGDLTTVSGKLKPGSGAYKAAKAAAKASKAAAAAQRVLAAKATRREAAAAKGGAVRLDLVKEKYGIEDKYVTPGPLGEPGVGGFWLNQKLKAQLPEGAVTTTEFSAFPGEVAAKAQVIKQATPTKPYLAAQMEAFDDIVAAKKAALAKVAETETAAVRRVVAGVDEDVVRRAVARVEVEVPKVVPPPAVATGLPDTVYHTYNDKSAYHFLHNGEIPEQGVFGLGGDVFDGTDPFVPNEYGNTVVALKLNPIPKDALFVAGEQQDALEKLFGVAAKKEFEDAMDITDFPQEVYLAADKKIAAELKARGYWALRYTSSEQYGEEFAILDARAIAKATNKAGKAIDIKGVGPHPLPAPVAPVPVAKKQAVEAAINQIKTEDAVLAWLDGGTPVGADVLDLADYSHLPGWAAPTGTKGQSYGVILFNKDGKVLLRQPTNNYGGSKWTFAKGGGEKPGTTALAELAEETGHKGTIYDVLPDAYKGQATKTNYFLGTSGGFDPNLMDAETYATKWMTYEEAKAAIGLGTNPVAVARDLKVLGDAFGHIQNSDGTAFAALAKSGYVEIHKAAKAAEVAAHSHKVKLGMAQKHYTKPKFGGGVTDADWVNPGTKGKLNDDGLNKVLSDKGWHLTTVPNETFEALWQADDVVAQKVVLDNLKKAPKGTPLPVAPKPGLPDATPHQVTLEDFANPANPTIAELDAALSKGALAPDDAYKNLTQWMPGYEDRAARMTTEETVRLFNKFKAANPHLYGGGAKAVRPAKLPPTPTQPPGVAATGEGIPPGKGVSGGCGYVVVDQMLGGNGGALVDEVYFMATLDEQLGAIHRYYGYKPGAVKLPAPNLDLDLPAAPVVAVETLDKDALMQAFEGTFDFLDEGELAKELDRVVGAGDLAAQVRALEKLVGDEIDPEELHKWTKTVKAGAPSPAPAAPSPLVSRKDFTTPTAVNDALLKGATVADSGSLFYKVLDWVQATGAENFSHDWSNTKKAAYINAFKRAHPDIYPGLKGGVPAPVVPRVPKAAPVVPVAPPTDFAVPTIGQLTKVKDLPGSTKPWLAKDATGKQWVVKDVGRSGIAPDHLRSEGVTDELYRRLGIATNRGRVMDTPEGPVKVTEFFEGGQTLAAWRAGKGAKEIAEMDKEIRKGFVADALFANHDVAGLSNDNIFIVAGKPIRIDNGGGLAFRAQGGKKETWGPKVKELTTMRDAATNANTAKIYGGVTDAEIHAQIRHIVANRDALLQGVPDAAVRSVLAARIDDLAAQLPKATTAAGRAAPEGLRRAVYGNTPEAAERAKKAKSNGLNLAGDSGDVEDNNLLVWEELDDTGAPVTKLQFKVTRQGSDKVKGVLGEELKRAQSSLVAAKVSNTHPDDTFWDSIQAAAKTIGTHHADKAYNAGTLQLMENSKQQITAQLATATGGKKEMLQHYADAIDRLEASKTAPAPLTVGSIKQYIYKPPAASATPAPVGFRVRSDNGINFRTVEYKNGVGKFNHGANNFTADEAYVIEAPDGIEIKFLPNDGNYSEASGRALHGTINVTVPDGVTQASVDRALAVVRDLGIDTTPPSAAYEEALYLHRGVYINNKHTSAGYKAIWESDDTPEVKVPKLKEWIKDNMGIDVSKAGYYDPAGITKHADGSGFRHWLRWDLTAEEVWGEMSDYTLQHTTSNGVPTLIKGVLESGGEFTTTTGRIRKGVSVRATGGMSAVRDVQTGGASYFFTRIRKIDRINDQGVFFKPTALLRQDAVSYDDDEYGAIRKLSIRKASISQYKEVASNSSNETIFKEGLSIADIDFIRVRPEDVARVVKEFNDHGITTLPDGRDVADIVVSGAAIPKNRIP